MSLVRVNPHSVPAPDPAGLWVLVELLPRSHPFRATAKVTVLNFIIDFVHLLFAAGAVLRLTEDSVALCTEQVFAQVKKGPKQPVP